MSSKGSYSPRKLGSIIDMAHIVIGVLIFVMACFAILRPARYMILFPVIFLLASVLGFFNAWFLFSAYRRNSRKKIAGIVYAAFGLLLFILFVVSAISIWLHG